MISAHGLQQGGAPSWATRFALDARTGGLAENLGTFQLHSHHAGSLQDPAVQQIPQHSLSQSMALTSCC